MTAEVVPSAQAAERADGNSVDVDLEMARLQKNGLYFQAYTQMLANELAQFRSAISGRRSRGRVSTHHAPRDDSPQAITARKHGRWTRLDR